MLEGWIGRDKFRDGCRVSFKKKSSICYVISITSTVSVYHQRIVYQQLKLLLLSTEIFEKILIS